MRRGRAFAVLILLLVTCTPLVLIEPTNERPIQGCVTDSMLRTRNVRIVGVVEATDSYLVHFVDEPPRADGKPLPYPRSRVRLGPCSGNDPWRMRDAASR